MKQRIFSKGNGWYISATNYKDKEDKAYMNIYFTQNSEPLYQDNGRGFSVKTINILEAKFTSYKNKIGLTIFKYELLEDIPQEKHEQTSLTGTNRGVDGFTLDEIASDNNLPFY